MLSHLLYSFNLPRIIPRTREKIIKPMRPEIFKLVLLCENKEGGEGKRERDGETHNNNSRGLFALQILIII